MKQVAARAALVLMLLAGCQRSVTSSGELSWAIGTWHGARRAADDEHDVPMTVRVERLTDGQVERLQVELTPRPYVGFTIRSRDAAGQWTMIYANSTRPNIGRLLGKLEGNRSTWESITSGPSHGSRFVSEQLDANHWRRTQFVSDDSGKTWACV
jgi:hypothetical protein